MAYASLFVLMALVASVVFGPLLWSLPINEIDFSAQLQGPSWKHPFGTDDLGQDLLARMTAIVPSPPQARTWRGPTLGRLPHRAGFRSASGVNQQRFSGPTYIAPGGNTPQ